MKYALPDKTPTLLPRRWPCRYTRGGRRCMKSCTTGRRRLLKGPCQVTHFTVVLNDNRKALHDHVVDLCKRFSVPAPAQDSSCLYQDFGGFELRWERHMEFANFTFICPDTSPFAPDALRQRAERLAGGVAQAN